MTVSRAVVERAIACLDLTNLNAGVTPEDIDDLCARAQTPLGPVAAVCVYPRHVAQARAALAGTPIAVATVVNFPDGDGELDAVRAMTSDALADGAQEIDLVIPWRALLGGNEVPVRECLRLVRRTAGGSTLKAILETGELREPDVIRKAAELAVEEGADFLKTSTGKASAHATPDAVRILLEVARDAGRPVGVKPSGGIRTAEEAAAYLDLCDEVMGPDWATPKTLRFGASGVLSALLAATEGRAGEAGAGY